MKKKMILLAVAAAAIVTAALTAGGTLAFFTGEAKVDNVITMGNVSVSLTEPDFSSSTGGTLSVSGVTPGLSIHKDPTVTNTGDNDAYVRCKVTVTGELDDSQKSQLLNGIVFKEGWVQSGDYYYFQNPLLKRTAASGTSALLFDKVVIPSVWNGAIAEKEFQIRIVAEAIQADHFTPARTDGKITGWNYTDGNPVVPSASPAV